MRPNWKGLTSMALLPGRMSHELAMLAPLIPLSVERRRGNGSGDVGRRDREADKGELSRVGVHYETARHILSQHLSSCKFARPATHRACQ